ncbi:MAG: Spy/CpxP family protein refolding chaperone [Verrucomicrobia bacterium]|nr:Spy/CpxP family protein refolding chaperone [Verrucomicrobiota bacterium]
MRNRLTAVASAMLALCMGSAVIAAEFGPPGGGRPPHEQDGPDERPGSPGHEQAAGHELAAIGRLINNPKIAEAIGLTDAQVNTLREGMFDFREQRAKLKADLEVAAIQQARVLTADPVDEKALMEAVEKTGAIRTEVAKIEMKALLMVRNTLTEEQREKTREMVRRRGHRDGGPRGQLQERHDRDDRRDGGPRPPRPDGRGPREGAPPPPHADEGAVLDEAVE